MPKKKSCVLAQDVPQGGCCTARPSTTIAEVVLVVITLACVTGLLKWGYAPVEAVSMVVIVIVLVIAIARTQAGAWRTGLVRLLGIEARALGAAA
ncbi:hypothetical protein JNUCC0626_32225 [Lentzea sp. JNUCC 0626]|uniref:hypothetical protein n=1 Tax=Lentzea sp. JNUCC 0626 TaxID=3367513 RepID=UPI00374A751F